MKKNDGNFRIKISRFKVSDLKPHPKNPRKHPAPGTAEWGNLKASLEHDYFDPLIINSRNGMLVSGHLRAKVLSSMGVPAVDAVVVDYDEETHLARMMTANNESGDWAADLLAKLVVDLPPELGLITGFKESEMQKLLAAAAAMDDRSTETQASPDSPEGFEAPISHVRMVQLFLTTETHPDFAERAALLATRYGTGNLTDTVMEAMRREVARKGAVRRE